MRRVVQQALVGLAAEAVRGHMLHTRLVITVLCAAQHVQAIQRGAAPFTAQHREHVAARQRRPGVEGERHEVAVAPLTRFHGPHMVGRGRFPLNAQQLQRGAVAHRDLDHGVGEVRHISERHIALNHRGLGVPVGNEDMTRMTHDAGAIGVGYVQDVHRHIDHHFPGHMNEHPLAGERRVEGREAVAVGRSRHAQVTRQQRRLLFGRGGERHHAHPIGERAKLRQRRRIPAVQEHHQWPRATEGVGLECCGIERIHRALNGCRERRGGDGRHTGVLPVFTARGWKAQARKRLRAGSAQRGKRCCRAIQRRRGEGARLYVEIHRGARRGVHRRAHAASSTQSYPRASSSSASDLSPDFTMRPPASTCT